MKSIEHRIRRYEDALANLGRDIKIASKGIEEMAVKSKSMSDTHVLYGKDGAWCELIRRERFLREQYKEMLNELCGLYAERGDWPFAPGSSRQRKRSVKKGR